MADCAVCRKLQFDRFDELDEGIRGFGIPRRTLAASSQAGCETCLIIHDAWTTTQVGLSSFKTYVCLRKTTMEAPLLIAGGNTVHRPFYESQMMQIYTLQGGEANKVWPSIGVARDVLDNPISTAAMKLAKEWLEECISPTHAGCQSSIDTRLPTRVIDLGVEGEHPRVLVTNGTRGKYVTLSHCWGKVSPLVTTKSTLEKRIAGISVAELPKTFQDAILVTHVLGFRYLWIDSLCIVQDSKEDWEIESSRMQDVYACAIFNISADAALDSTAGLGTRRRLPLGKAVGSPKNGDYVCVGPMFDWTDSSGVSHVPRDKRNLKHILDTRGWVLQERMLSPRILHFSEYEMAWECDTCCRCECTVLPRKPARSFRGVLGDSQLSKKEGLQAWFNLIGKYSTLDLTRESDKLPAIAGLASRAANHLSKTYIAGLWKEDLPHCLLWTSVSNE
ncbi:heterokaryon incompatibility protein-domain-containing protein [Hyaloscypha finlandica]|nr:heterokaryon incompatibility protein-domain-containing protein [Hyaloscypha finlandica]